jgi:diguanylate cyclase (GGDEF)-like protein
LLRLLSLLLLLCCAPAAAQLQLVDAQPRVDAWPQVTMLADPGNQMLLADVRAAAGRFEPPRLAYSTLGLRKDAVWLRLPLQVDARSDGRWILAIDYSVLNRVDVHLIGADGSVRQQAVLGNLQPYAQRPLPGRTHAVQLELVPGERAELYLRVETLGGMVLPISLSKLGAFHAQALDEQLLQGLLSGLGVWLLLYSLMQWATLREPLFLKYAMLISGSILFSIYQFGIGAQYLWTGNTWIELHAGGLTALVASAGTFLFVEQALAPHPRRWFSPLMKIGCALLMLTAVAYALDWIHVHQVSNVIGTLGLAPAVLGMPGAISRARRGDPVGWTLLVAWIGYFVSTAVMVGLIKGRVDLNFWTLHSFQLGATLDMLLFMRVIGLRMKAVHTAAQSARRERDSLVTLAQTDPLTGLANRRGLDEMLAAALPNCTPQKLLAVYVLDLDGFKQVNDRYGHDTGDEMLVAVGRRLKNSLRTTDVVARVGGDEFVIVVTGLHDDRQALEVGSHVLAAFEEPFMLSHGRICSVGLTIGYALVPPDGDDAAALLKRADAAMYAGKQGGKRCVRRAEPIAA